MKWGKGLGLPSRGLLTVCRMLTKKNPPPPQRLHVESLQSGNCPLIQSSLSMCWCYTAHDSVCHLHQNPEIQLTGFGCAEQWDKALVYLLPCYSTMTFAPCLQSDSTAFFFFFLLKTASQACGHKNQFTSCLLPVWRVMTRLLTSRKMYIFAGGNGW